jgi:hypothetical protein
MAMQSIRTALMAAAAALMFAGAAAAESGTMHTMTVQLPNGGVAKIRYAGDVPPQVILNRDPLPVASFAALPSLFDFDAPFAELRRISTEMDRRAAQMMREAAMLSSGSPQMIETALRDLPAGAQSYSFVSTMSGNAVCTRSVQITSTGNGAPKVVRHSSGNCGPETGASGSATRPAEIYVPMRPAPAPKRPDVLWTSNQAKSPYAGMVQQTAAHQR